MIRLTEYLTPTGQSPFAIWFDSLTPPVAARLRTHIKRFELGNLGDYAAVGDGVLEKRIHFGPGYRLYFAFDGKTVILLLAGGTKQTQPNDIAKAKSYWKDYQARKEKS